MLHGMHGPRYDELFAKQARIEREMLGLNDKCELWRAREEMGTEAWSVEKFLAKMDIIQKARTNSGSVSGIIINDRIASWSTYRMFSNRCEYDIVGRALDDIALMEAETGSLGILDAILRNACWSEDRKRPHTLLRKVEEQRRDARRRNSKKRRKRRR